MKTTFVDRANTNQEVLRRANEQLGRGKQIKMLIQVYLQRKQLCLDKEVMANGKDPIRSITFTDKGVLPRLHLPRRVGRPKAKWANEECKRLWQKAQEGKRQRIPYDPHSEEQGVEIMGLAQRVMEKKKR